LRFETTTTYAFISFVKCGLSGVRTQLLLRATGLIGDQLWNQAHASLVCTGRSSTQAGSFTIPKIVSMASDTWVSGHYSPAHKEHLQQCSVCDPAKMFFTSKFSYLLFRNPKTEIGQQIRGELLIAIHLDQSLRWANQKHWLVVRSYLLHSFRQVPFTSHRKLCNDAPPKPFSWKKLWLFFIQFYCADHMLSTAGDALRKSKFFNLNTI
jgi:hypothetical protein